MLEGEQALHANVIARRTRDPERDTKPLMPPRLPAVLSALLVVIGPLVPTWPPSPAEGLGLESRDRMVVIRNAETEALLHTFANPLFRAAGPESWPVRIVLVRDRAINAFASTGNRMFTITGLLRSG
jgi:Zn-dependent protease with chaperone function